MSGSVDFLLVQRALRASWARDTAQDVRWTPERPSTGQCCVSSMVVQTYFGGALARGITNLDGVHYWNQLEDGSWFDSTRAQFEPTELVVEYVLHPDPELYLFRETLEKFDLLLGRVRAYVAAESGQLAR